MTPHRGTLGALLAAALAAVVAVTLVPTGSGGWEWGSPATELRWYATGLDSEATLLQLVGNLGLLVVPAAVAVVLWPALRHPLTLAIVAVTAAGAIELLQWALPLGRVVSPLDAVLNATGALLAGLIIVTGLRANGDQVRSVAVAAASPAVDDAWVAAQLASSLRPSSDADPGTAV